MFTYGYGISPFLQRKQKGMTLYHTYRCNMVEMEGFDVSDVKTVRRSVFTIGVTQSKECGAGGYAARHGRLCDGDRRPAGGRYPPFHARQREKENDFGGREMRVSAAPRRKLKGSKPTSRPKKHPRTRRGCFFV